ncbi:hypothetical protein WJX72_000678 [[Myrmecia] bisecta]|uniref:AB hydrolase-1 domain-containing protein n=1 Tax=[Myrmecia] bisecta TaxID=41462 RepID=A0AAW1PVH4_9CHLO
MRQETKSLTLSDGCKLAYERVGSEDRALPNLVLLHGWSASRHYFDLNVSGLAKHCTVWAVDQRFHGSSGRPTWGYHIARLAADLREFLEILDLWEVTVVGTSMGAAVIWAYIELFGHSHLSKLVFVDQAPLQNVAEDWKLGSKGCYDSASLARLQSRLTLDFPGFAADTVRDCMTRPVGESVKTALIEETLRCNPRDLARLMADHTQLDWRPILPRIAVPCLNLVGRQSEVFPWQGCAVVGEHIPECQTIYFEGANHWLYIEEPEKFNSLVTAFVQHGLIGVKGKSSV